MGNRTYYKQVRGEPCDDPSELRYYDYRECDEAEAQWFQHGMLLSGDYCGAGLVAVANRQAITDEFPELDGVAYWPDHGSHGSQWLWFKADLTAYPELAEMLDRLDDYIALDEDLWCDLEHEAEQEAWESCLGADDFRRELTKLAPHHEELFVKIDNGTLYHTWSLYCDKHRGGETCIHETGGCHFPFPDEGRAWTWPVLRSFLLEALDER